MMRYLIYPLLLGGAISLALFLFRQGVAAELVLPVVNGIAFAIAIGLEWRLPYYKEWSVSQRDFGVDLLNLVFSSGIAALAAQQLAFLIAEQVGLPKVWPNDWPIVVQLFLALVVGEFFNYWIHRIQHEKSGLLWRFHATHHSVHRLYWLNGNRVHPGDTFFATLAFVLSVALLGGTQEIFLFVGVYSGVHLVMQHANMDYKLGVLNWVFSGAEAHRWHHSKKLEEANHNYGSVILLWDVLFRTRFLPRDKKPPIDVGLIGMDNFPETYVGQLLSPFQSKYWK